MVYEFRIYDCGGSAVDYVEIMLLERVLSEALKVGFKEKPERGTIVIYEQQRGRDMECAWAFDLRMGVAEFQCNNGEMKSSRCLAEEALEGLAKWPDDKSMYEETPSKLNFGQLKTDVYSGRDLHYGMILNTTLGRFLMTSYLDFGLGDIKRNTYFNKTILLVMRDVFVELRPEDMMLKRFSNDGLSSSYIVSGEKLSWLATEIMRKGNFSEVREWKAWREKEILYERMSPFFDKHFKH